VDPEAHRPIYGLTHGTLLFLALGRYLGNAAQHPVAGTVGGALVGMLTAGSFYLLAPFAGSSGMFVSYFGVWIGLALLVRWLGLAQMTRGEVVTRSVVEPHADATAFACELHRVRQEGAVHC
jgi:hypothetical protein